MEWRQFATKIRMNDGKRREKENYDDAEWECGFQWPSQLYYYHLWEPKRLRERGFLFLVLRHKPRRFGPSKKGTLSTFSADIIAEWGT